MATTTCIDCGILIAKGPRCERHERRYDQAHRTRRAAIIQAEPWCHNPDCPYPDVGSASNPLTREHLPGGGDTVLCHRCNSSRSLG